MIKNIIFDIGKVLVEFDPDGYMRSMGLTEEAIDAINKAMFQNRLWNLYDQGIYTSEEYLAKFIAGAPQYELQIRQIYATIGKTITMYPYTMEWLRELKERGYRLYVLSNYAEHTMEQTREKLEFLPLMDGAVFSYECKLLKPSIKIYEHLCRKYNLNCSECIFVDDRYENVEGAQRSGIPALWFQDYEQAKVGLEEMIKY